MITVFSDSVVGTTTVYSNTDYNPQLASVDQLAVQICSDQVSGSTPTITAVLQHSADGRNWMDKTTLASAVSLNPAMTNVAIASDAGTTPTLGLARISITLGGTTPVAHVKVHVTGRDAAS
jgi:hypothetical protein